MSVRQERIPSSEKASWLGNLDALADTVPEIAAKRDALAPVMESLASQYRIDPELLDDPANTLVLAAIASRALDGESCQPDTFLGYATKVLRNSQQVDNLGVDQNTERLYLDGFTDWRLSRELRVKVDNGLLDDVKQALTVTPETEDPYDIRVLNITLGSQGKEFAHVASAGEDEDAPEDLLPSQFDQDVERWYAGLKDRQRELFAAIDKNGLLWKAAAWAAWQSGVTTIYVSMPLAEMVLDPAFADRTYDDGHSLASLQHEYTHTQGGLQSPDCRIGIGLEELRAEHFSEDMGGYIDVKVFYQHYWELTGTRIPAVFDGLPKGGTQEELFNLIANEIGLDLMLEAILLQPRDYTECEINPDMLAVQSFLGDWKSVISRIRTRQIEKGLGREIEERSRPRKKQRERIMRLAETMQREAEAYNRMVDKLVANLE